MKRNDYKQYLKDKKIKSKYDEEVVVNNNSTVIKVLLFLYDLLLRIIKVLFYIGILIACSIGATYIANKIGIIKF